MLRRSMLLASFCGLLAFISSLVFAQQKPNIAGDYAGSLGSLHVKLHLKIDAEGSLTGTLNSPDQGASGIPCADFHFDGQSLSFAVPWCLRFVDVQPSWPLSKMARADRWHL